MIHPFFLYAAIALICAGAIAGFILRERLKKSKGTFEIKLAKGRANFHETVDGEIRLSCYKDLDIDSIEVSLVSLLRTRSGTVSGNAGRRTVYSEAPIYSETLVLREMDQLRAGTDEVLSFSFQMPSPLFDRPEEKNLRKHFTLKNQRDIRWQVKAELRCKGVNLDDDARLVVPYISADHTAAA